MLKIKSIFCASLGAIALTLSLCVSAGPVKVFGTHYASVNDWGEAGAIQLASWGTGSTANFTSSWNRTVDKLIGYPSIVRGRHYSYMPSGYTDSLFPKKISSISSANCTLNFTMGGTNVVGNIAYDLFLRDTATVGNPKTEIMIWGRHNSWPIGTKTKSSALTVGGITYDLWEGYNSAAGYYVFSFVPVNTVFGTPPTLQMGSGSLNINLKTFLNWLGSNRTGSNYNNSWYLHVIEGGMEVRKGTGAWVWLSGNFSA